MINALKHDAVLHFVKESRVPVLVTHTDGRIVWANRAFCKWIGYTLSELVTIGWKRLLATESVQPTLDALRALDTDSSVEMQIQLTPKNDRPAWGTYTSTRWPVSGDIEYCICTWEPVRMGGVLFDELRELSLKISAVVNQSEEDRWVLSTLSLIRKYPRVSMAILAVMLGVFGINNIAELLERVHVIPPTIQQGDK